MSSFKKTYYVKVFQLAADGLSKGKIASAIGVQVMTLNRWLEKDEALKEAFEEGRDKYTQGGENASRSLDRYIYKRLPDNLKELWDKISDCDNQRNGITRMENLLASAGKYARMHLFIHAMVSSSFNVSEACRKVNISMQTVRNWNETEPGFAEILDEVIQHKKNFIEGALMKKIRDGDISAIIFANKTINRDRGYNDKQEIVHTGHISHSHSEIDLDSLPFSLKKQILEHIRGVENKEPEALEYRMNGSKAVPITEENEE